MGCSPPDWWYDQQDAFYFAKAKREHEQAVKNLINTVANMTPEEKEELRKAIESAS